MEEMPLHVVLVSAIIKKEDKYLLGLRASNDDQAGGTWSFIGGKVDFETGHGIIESTLAREAEEEAGVKIKDSIQLLTTSGFIRSSGHHVVSLTFLAEYLSGKAQPLDGQDEVKWFTLNEIKGLIHNDSRITYLLPTVELLETRQ
ncbi:MAG: NUDIX domain-containing protein [Candidatus Dojkabacteria bacterium]|nr:MAG: NUDIX domain-containing protein [Candidatus Dojkabacteria bacterium]